jgi:hypothetical protein
VPQVVGEPAIGELHALEIAHRRHDVGDRGIADRHQVERLPVAGHVVGQPLVHPEGKAATEERAGDDVELEDVRQLMRNEAIERIRRLVDRQHHSIAVVFREREHPFGQFTRDDVLLLELALGLVQDHRHPEGEVVLQVGADLLVGAFRVRGHALELRLQVRVVIHLEVVGRVDLPLEVVVPDTVLPVIRHVWSLRESLFDTARQKTDRRKSDRQRGDGAARIARAHRISPRKGSGWRQPGRAYAAFVRLLIADVTVAKTVVATPPSPPRRPGERQVRRGRGSKVCTDAGALQNHAGRPGRVGRCHPPATAASPLWGIRYNKEE